MSSPDLAALWPALCRQRPQAGALARLVCLPVRVTPAFLRRVRLHLLPHSGTGDEADLWLSDLVETRTTAGFSLRRAVRAQLREALADDSTTLDAVWQGAHRPHAIWLAPRARLEEELTWRLLRDRADPAIVAAWASVLQQLDVAPDAEAWARWVVRAVPDLPAGALHTLPAQRAWRGAHLLLGDASVLGDQAQTFLASTDFSFATRRLPRRTVYVGRLADGLVVSPVLAIENGFALSIPATRPLWLQVEVAPDGGPAGGGGTEARLATKGKARSKANVASSAAVALPAPAPQVLVMDGVARVQVVIDGGSLLLRAIDGAAWRLSPPPEVPYEAPAAPPSDEAPRVRLTYEVEAYGAIRQVELPFVVGVLADLSGELAERLPPLADRRFATIDRDNFDDCLKAARPRVAIQVPDALSDRGLLAFDLHFEALADFSPEAVLQRLAPLREHLAQRDGLATRDPSVAVFDERLARQLNLVLHHEAFQSLEGTWRGLRRLVDHADTGDRLKIRVLNVGKQELMAAMLPDLGLGDDGQGDADPAALEARLQRIGRAVPAKLGTAADITQTVLFKKVYEEEVGQLGGEPYGLLVGDYHFDHSAPDVLLLDALGQVAAAAFAPLVTGAAPGVLQVESWQELAKSRDLGKIATAPEYAGWRALRRTNHARYIGLAMPRMLARAPYLAQADSAPAFQFTEDLGGADADNFTWANAAYAMAANIARAHSLHGWCARIHGIEGGGLVPGLPTAMMPTVDGSVARARTTEAMISDRREAELAKFGFMPLVHRQDSDFAMFVSAASLHQPNDNDDPAARERDALAARWAYLLPACRFMHYIKCIARDKIGGFQDDESMRRHLEGWLKGYVGGHPDRSGKQLLRPLASGQVHFLSTARNAGTVDAQIELLPAYQLGGLNTPMQLTTTLPSLRSPA